MTTSLRKTIGRLVLTSFSKETRLVSEQLMNLAQKAGVDVSLHGKFWISQVDDLSRGSLAVTFDAGELNSDDVVLSASPDARSTQLTPLEVENALLQRLVEKLEQKLSYKWGDVGYPPTRMSPDVPSASALAYQVGDRVVIDGRIGRVSAVYRQNKSYDVDMESGSEGSLLLRASEADIASCLMTSDEYLRLCTDYERLNTRNLVLPIPHIGPLSSASTRDFDVGDFTRLLGIDSEWPEVIRLAVVRDTSKERAIKVVAVLKSGALVCRVCAPDRGEQFPVLFTCFSEILRHESAVDTDALPQASAGQIGEP